MKPLILILLAGLASHATAQTIWRCGADGTRFQATPCAEGRTMALRPPPPEAAVQEAHEVAQRERLALQTLADERREREREAAERGLGPAGIKPLPKAPDRPARRQKKKLPPWVLPAPGA